MILHSLSLSLDVIPYILLNFIDIKNIIDFYQSIISYLNVSYQGLFTGLTNVVWFGVVTFRRSLDRVLHLGFPTNIGTLSRGQFN